MTGIELFALGSTTVTLGNVLSAASLLSGVAGIFGGSNAEADMHEYNARLEELQGAQIAAQERREARLRMSAINQGAAASGVTMEGTPLMVLAESAANAEVDAMNAQWNASQRANLDRTRAKNARGATPYRVGTSLLSGVSAFGGFGGASATSIFGGSSAYPDGVGP